MIKENIEIGKIQDNEVKKETDEVAVEKSFRIKTSRGGEHRVSCTPEDLDEFTVGMLFARGDIQSIKEIKEIKISLEAGEIYADLRKPSLLENRNLEKKKMPDPLDKAALFSMAEEIFLNPGPLFSSTGCAHCCTFVSGKETLCKIEDIGRHNALDKGIGYCLLNGIDLGTVTVFTTGRVSADYMEKIIRSGIRTVVSRAAVTDAAVTAARRHGITLYGFVRGRKGNQYSPAVF